MSVYVSQKYRKIRNKRETNCIMYAASFLKAFYCFSETLIIVDRQYIITLENLNITRFY